MSEEVRCATLADAAEVVAGTTWLWPGWLPRGQVSLLAAAPGEGKSWLVLDLVARMFVGGEWPDGKPCDRADHVMWVDTEGTQAVLVERAKRLDLDLDRIILPMSEPIQELRLDDRDGWKTFKKAVQDKRPPLVVVDTLRGSHLGDESSSKETAPLMKALQLLARDADVAILVVHHTRKRSELAISTAVTLDCVRGSNAIAANARAVWVIEPVEDGSEGLKRLRVEKSNLAAKPDPLGFTVGEEGVRWRDLPDDPVKRGELERAAEFLRVQLAGGPRRMADVEEHAQNTGISPSTLRRAKSKCGVLSVKMPGAGGQWMWSMATPAAGGNNGSSAKGRDVGA